MENNGDTIVKAALLNIFLVDHNIYLAIYV